MIVSVCADKGSPGVSTTATVLGMIWPGERVILEADPSGGDAVLRMRTPQGQLLARQPALRSLAVDARSGSLPTSLLNYAHHTSLGVPVIPATDMRTEDFALIARQWPAIAAVADQWPGTVIADMGRLQEDSSTGPIAAASTIVLLIARATPEGLYHLRERASALAARLGQGIHGRSPLTVAVICPAREHSARLRDVKAHLAGRRDDLDHSGSWLDRRGPAQRARLAGRPSDEEARRRRPVQVGPRTHPDAADLVATDGATRTVAHCGAGRPDCSPWDTNERRRVVAVSDMLDYTLIRKLQGQVADAQLADRRHLQAAGQPVRSTADEQQQAQSMIRQVVSRHLQDMLARREELPVDPAFETRLRSAIFSAIYGAGELQELLEDELVENIDINGCEQTWVTYAGGIKELWRPVAATNEDLISIVQNLGSYAGMNARPFSPATPELDVRLQDGSRLSAVMSATETPRVRRSHLAGEVGVPVARSELVQRHHHTTVTPPSATTPIRKRTF